MSAARVFALGSRLSFFCPGCDEAHAIDRTWQFNEDLEKPTFSPSVLLTRDRHANPAMRVCHSFVRDGRIQFFTDSTHALAGQTVDLPEYPEGWK